ncbi:hypothetical protein NHQ30_001719 [Ciborinia camelliae]|nr:hypothetical protein NHQ30_001719 [Ciborinia camelliae]
MSSNSPEENGGMNGGVNGEENASTPATTTISKPADTSNPAKTDKPKPHGCIECGRHFARLEHLKRHERSHTKEKPYECDICTRRFARRDLLLRHQQKLHSNTTPSARPRHPRGSSSNAAGTGGSNGVRKNTTATGHMRQRANTTIGIEMAGAPLVARNQNHVNHPNHGHSRHPSLAELPMHRDYVFGGMSGILGMSSAMNQRGMNHGLKVETSALDLHGMDHSNHLQTAPLLGSFGNPEFDFQTRFQNFVFPTENGSTINPSDLHFNDSPQSMEVDFTDPFNPNFSDTSVPMLDDNAFSPMDAFRQMNFNAANENAIDGSSPSAISTASYSGISEGVMLDGSNNTAANPASMWHQPVVGHQPMMGHPLMTQNFVDHGNQNFANSANGNSIPPHSLPQNHANQQYFHAPSPLGLPTMPRQNNHQGFHPTMNFGLESLNSMTGGIHGSLPSSTNGEAAPATLATGLVQDAPFGGGKFSFPSANSPAPQSPRFSTRANSVNESTRFLPSTSDLQRYIDAYIKYFHPHLPFLHIPTLVFDPSIYADHGRVTASSIEGNGCLALSMAAIGALYEKNGPQAQTLFESAKKTLLLYLEERRKADVRRADHRKTSINYNSRAPETYVETPVWLTQAMLLNIIYGANCGDKIAGEIALTHCATLVSLAKAAELVKPPCSDNGSPQQDARMTDGDDVINGYIKSETSDDEQEWLNWKVEEEKRRTLYAIFILSSMLVSAYNHAPFLTNSEILSELPCEEEFWSAGSASDFYHMGGSRMANKQTTFKAALSELLQASNNQQHQQAQAQSFGNGQNTQDLPQSDLTPSSFGCLILINALHNFIWETRQRHTNSSTNNPWTYEDTEKMQRRIEPALRAWQLAWQRNPRHTMNLPSPLGPLGTDCVPLLDIAYVRLFVNMSTSKESFWKRDFDGMANELFIGSHRIQHARNSSSTNGDSMEFSGGSATSSVFVDSPTSSNSPDFKPPRDFKYPQPEMSPGFPLRAKRERHLRRAACYAADHLSMSDKFGVTYANLISMKLALQSAMCASDCAQAIAEWATTVQERVGFELGILGKDEVDMNKFPAMMHLDDEDTKLLHKIQAILDSAEQKMHLEQTTAGQMNASQRLPAGDNSGYGSKILRVTAYMLDKDAVWPVVKLLARALETQASHMDVRAERAGLQKSLELQSKRMINPAAENSGVQNSLEMQGIHVQTPVENSIFQQ